MDADFTEKLIREVRSRPVLYSPIHADYKNNVKKLQAWLEIETELNQEVATLKAKWKNLKDTYRKHKQSRRATPQSRVYRLYNWVWADLMSFIDVELPAHYDDYEDIYVDNHNINVEDTEDLNQELKQEHDEELNQEYDHDHENHQFVNSDRRVDMKFDGVDLLFLGHADAFKKLSRRKQIQVKLKIAKIMMEAELEDLKSTKRFSYSTMAEDILPENCTEEADNMDLCT